MILLTVDINGGRRILLAPKSMSASTPVRGGRGILLAYIY